MTDAYIAAIMTAICHTESGENPKAINIHDGGSSSYGYCQIKLSTARWLGYKGHASDLWFNKEINKAIATKYYVYLLKRYAGDHGKAVSAYNCGHVCNNANYQNRVWDKFGSRPLTYVGR